MPTRTADRTAVTHGVNKYIYVKHKHQQKYIQLRLINELKQKMGASELR